MLIIYSLQCLCLAIYFLLLFLYTYYKSRDYMKNSFVLHHILMLFSLGFLLIFHYFILFLEEARSEGAFLLFVLLLFSNWGFNAFKKEKKLVQNKVYYWIYNIALVVLIAFLGVSFISYFQNNHNPHFLKITITSGLPYPILLICFFLLNVASIFLKKETVIVKKDISNYFYISACLVSAVNIYHLFHIIGIYTNYPWFASIIGFILSMKLLSQNSYLFTRKDESRKLEFFLIICFLFMKEFVFALLTAFHLLTYEKTAS